MTVPRFMPKTITTLYDVAEHLRTPEEIAAYLEATIEDAAGDATLIAKTLGDVARAEAIAALSLKLNIEAARGDQNH
jgi:probable addiction module antidote protein